MFKVWPAYGVRNRVATAFVVATVPAAALRACSQSSINAVDAAPGDDWRAEGRTVVVVVVVVVVAAATATVVGVVLTVVGGVVGTVAPVVGGVASLLGAVGADAGAAARPGPQPATMSAPRVTAPATRPRRGRAIGGTGATVAEMSVFIGAVAERAQWRRISVR